MADAKLTALPQGTLPPDLYYGEVGGTSKKWTGTAILNVKDYGAIGNGIADDTAAIQAAFDAAYGSYASPHAASSQSNLPVYFPPGAYTVNPSIASRSITGAANNGGLIKLTVSTTGLTTGDGINIVGGAANGMPNMDGIFFVTVDDGTHLTLKSSQFGGSYSGSGATLTTPCLRLRQLQGGWIFGAGRFTTVIGTATANAPVFLTNRCEYSRFENMTISAATGGISFALDAMTPDAGATTSLQSNQFMNMFFGGGAVGVNLGAGQVMGSENLWLNCYFNLCSFAAITVWNFNACDNTVIGGNMAGGQYGIYIQSGSINTIHGVSFQTNSVADIYVINGASDSYSIVGCRSESANFLKTGASQPFIISGCNQTLGTSGFFFSGHGYITIQSCSSVNGYVDNGDVITIMSSLFSRSDYLTVGSDQWQSMTVIPPPITTVTASTYTFKGSDCNSKVIFNSASAQTVTLPRSNGNGTFLVPGAQIQVEQLGAGLVTFVAAGSVTTKFRSGLGLKMNGQNAVATLTLTGVDTWTLSGDLAP